MATSGFYQQIAAPNQNTGVNNEVPRELPEKQATGVPVTEEQRFAAASPNPQYQKEILNQNISVNNGFAIEQQGYSMNAPAKRADFAPVTDQQNVAVEGNRFREDRSPDFSNEHDGINSDVQAVRIAALESQDGTINEIALQDSSVYERDQEHRTVVPIYNDHLNSHVQHQNLNVGQQMYQFQVEQPAVQSNQAVNSTPELNSNFQRNQKLVYSGIGNQNGGATQFCAATPYQINQINNVPQYQQTVAEDQGPPMQQYQTQIQQPNPNCAPSAFYGNQFPITNGVVGRNLEAAQFVPQDRSMAENIQNLQFESNQQLHHQQQIQFQPHNVNNLNVQNNRQFCDFQAQQVNRIDPQSMVYQRCDGAYNPINGPAYNNYLQDEQQQQKEQELKKAAKLKYIYEDMETEKYVNTICSYDPSDIDDPLAVRVEKKKDESKNTRETKKRLPDAYQSLAEKIKEQSNTNQTSLNRGAEHQSCKLNLSDNRNVNSTRTYNESEYCSPMKQPRLDGGIPNVGFNKDEKCHGDKVGQNDKEHEDKSRLLKEKFQFNQSREMTEDDSPFPNAKQRLEGHGGKQPEQITSTHGNLSKIVKLEYPLRDDQEELLQHNSDIEFDPESDQNVNPAESQCDSEEDSDEDYLLNQILDDDDD
ncbi:hypothetical protein ACOME3_000976 [Neoechinorhynchus agilis]